MNPTITTTEPCAAGQTCHDNFGAAVRLLGFSCSWPELIWAYRFDDKSLRCYFANEIVLPDASARVGDFMESSKRLNSVAASHRVAELAKET